MSSDVRQPSDDSAPSPPARADRDQVIHWRTALGQPSAQWDEEQRQAFLDLLNHRADLLLHGAAATVRRTLAHTLGQHGDETWVMLALARCPAAAQALVGGALLARRQDLVWTLLQNPLAHTAWSVLDDVDLAERWAKNMAYHGGFERFQAWVEHAPASLARAIRQPRGRNHLANQAIAQRNLPLFNGLLQQGLAFDNASAGRPGSTLAHDLAYADWDDGLRALIAHGTPIDLNARNAGGLTPLLHATKYQRWRAAQTLLDAGVDVHAITPEGKQALWFATAGHQGAASRAPSPLLRGLLLAGADPDRPEGKTSRAGSVSAWMAANHPKAWQVLLVHRDTELLMQVADDALEPTLVAPPVPRSRARL